MSEGAVGGLLRAVASKAAQGTVYRSLKRDLFTGEAVSFRTFTNIVAVFQSLAFIEHTAGRRYFIRNLFDPVAAPVPSGGYASRFKATDALIKLCVDAGVTPGDARKHFVDPLPKHPLVLKAASRRQAGDKLRGRKMQYPRSTESEVIETQVKKLNEFLAGFQLEPYPHQGYVRIFNEGDKEGFAWNKGGRLYSQTDTSYQSEKKDTRLRMTINGDPVVEIDIQASYLVVLHGLLGLPFDTSSDPYAIDGFDRALVKAWTVATLGNAGHLNRWPRELSEGYEKKHGRRPAAIATVSEIRERMVTKHPGLANWNEQKFTWADLMFQESEAVIGTMLTMMDKGLPSYAVHDSLIVRTKDEWRKMFSRKNTSGLLGSPQT
jgi:hypothetical protein